MRSSRRAVAQRAPSERNPVGQEDAVIALDEVSLRFGELEVVRDLSFKVGRHERVSLVGPSGCGKSTLLSVIAGLVEPSSGQVRVDGDSGSRERLGHCALMPQRDLLLPWRSALDNTCLALENRGVSRKAARERARPMFERVGLAGFHDRSPDELSGGMRQRIAFVRTLLAEKDVLLLDEPFGALDAITRGGMHEWLLSVVTEVPQTVVMVTHDVEEALLLSHKVIVLTPRPAEIAVALDADYPTRPTRHETISTPEFVALKERALEALG